MKQILVFSLILLAAACMQKPAPVTADTATVDPADRPAIAVEYVAVPSMSVYRGPAENTEVIGRYGLTEAISVLERKGGWSMIRTFNGTGWVKSADLMNAEQAAKIDTAVPRFYVAPKAIPFSVRGEIWLQAKVNTDGDVVEVKPVKNTTRNRALEDANAEALMQAKFYPVIDKGARKVFIYEHRVYY